MLYTKAMFGNQLKEKILENANAIEIGIWAHSVYLDCSPEVDTNLLKVMLGLNTMELGPEFERTPTVLNRIADDLIAGKDIDLNSKEYRED